VIIPEVSGNRVDRGLQQRRQVLNGHRFPGNQGNRLQLLVTAGEVCRARLDLLLERRHQLPQPIAHGVERLRQEADLIAAADANFIGKVTRAHNRRALGELLQRSEHRAPHENLHQHQ